MRNGEKKKHVVVAVIALGAMIVAVVLKVRHGEARTQEAVQRVMQTQPQRCCPVNLITTDDVYTAQCPTGTRPVSYPAHVVCERMHLTEECGP